MTNYKNKLFSAIEPVIGMQSLPAEESNERSFLEDRARIRQSIGDLERQQNLERIVELALNETPEGVSELPATRDWLRLFFDLAQDVYDETAQQIWARMLALYIANPDTVSKRSLIALHGMDVWELKAFVEYCSFAFTLENGWRFVFEEAITRREMWGYVQGQDYTQHFINIGLLSAELAVMRPRSSKGMKIRYFYKEYELVQAIPTAELGPLGEAVDISFGYRKFTPTGQQISKAVNARVYNGYARNLIRTMDTHRNVQFRLLETEKAFAC